MTSKTLFASLTAQFKFLNMSQSQLKTTITAIFQMMIRGFKLTQNRDRTPQRTMRCSMMRETIPMMKASIHWINLSPITKVTILLKHRLRLINRDPTLWSLTLTWLLAHKLFISPLKAPLMRSLPTSIMMRTCLKEVALKECKNWFPISIALIMWRSRSSSRLLRMRMRVRQRWGCN
jgi:hypothetical protein